MSYKPVSHEKLKQEALSNKKVLKAYEELEDEFNLIAELIKARKMAGKSQTEIAKQMHTTQSTVARLEAGFGQKRHSPTLNTLKRYAKSVGCKVMIKLVPEKRHIA